MKVKVKFLISIAGNDFSYAPGQEAHIDAKLAAAWIASGVCIAVESESKEKK